MKVILIFTLIITILYILATFTSFPLLSRVRIIWIETAMTTAEHQWLATKFFPKFVIEDVMNNKFEDVGEIGVTLLNEEVQGLLNNTGIDYNVELGSKDSNSIFNVVVFDDEDPFENKVIVNDLEQGLKIVEVKTSTYTGKLVFIDDPSRVIIGETEDKGRKGDLILNYLSRYDAIVGINANGFADFEGKGLGGEIIGCSISDGVLWGETEFSTYTTIGFDIYNRLVVGKLTNPEEYKLRDAGQFKPALIINGEILVDGSAGWGIQPRTIVAQRSDGVVMFLVIDGRKPGYSIGITMGECAKLLKSYGAVTAAACDGGSSSVLAYNGEIINKPSTPMVTGRYLPNVFLVKRK